MRVTSLLNKLLHLPGLWILGLRFEENALIVMFRRRFRLLTCPDCGTQVRGRFEETTRRWRHLSLWGQRLYLEGPIRRLRCPTCQKVRAERVPWARPGSDFTQPFEDVVGYLAQHLSKTAVAELAEVAWATVGRIAQRLVTEKLDPHRFEGLRRIGVDEISYRKHHKYLTVVVNHDIGKVIWIGEGKSADVLKVFFERLSAEQLATIEIVSMDLSAAFQKAVRESLPGAEIVFDKFHVTKLAQKALDEVRRALVRELPAEDRTALKKSRWVLLRRPDTALLIEDEERVAGMCQ